MYTIYTYIYINFWSCICMWVYMNVGFYLCMYVSMHACNYVVLVFWSYCRVRSSCGVAAHQTPSRYGLPQPITHFGIKLGVLVVVDFMNFRANTKSAKNRSWIEIVAFWALLVFVVCWVFQNFQNLETLTTSVFMFLFLSEMTSSSRSGDVDILEDAVYDVGLLKSSKTEQI